MYVSAVLTSRNTVCNWKACFPEPLWSEGTPGYLSRPLPILPREKVDSQQMIPQLSHREARKCEARDELLKTIEQRSTNIFCKEAGGKFLGFAG